MKVLITGGAGFMGSDLVRKLVKEDFEVYVVDKLTYAGDIKRIESFLDNIKFFREDITDKQAIAQIFENVKPKVVIHYAAETHVDRSIINPDIFVKTNVIGTLNLLELSLKHKVEKIHSHFYR
jgi:dTDP-glucose 4,6-dehydratase